MMLPRAVDAQGRIYFALGGGFGRADSTSIGRYDRATETIDTVARVKPREVRRSESRGGGGRGVPDIGAFEWPSRMPAFRAGATVIDPYGGIWVGRTTKIGVETLYDVFDGEGNKTGEVAFSPNSRTIGFGTGTAYVVRTDEFGLQWLERYRID